MKGFWDKKIQKASFLTNVNHVLNALRYKSRTKGHLLIIYLVPKRALETCPKALQYGIKIPVSFIPLIHLA